MEEGNMAGYQFYNLTVRLAIDGNQWMAVVGENIQDGVAGFGNTVNEAIHDLGLCADRDHRNLLNFATAAESRPRRDSGRAIIEVKGDDDSELL
jgi:hypothetical protein